MRLIRERRWIRSMAVGVVFVAATLAHSPAAHAVVAPAPPAAPTSGLGTEGPCIVPTENDIQQATSTGTKVSKRTNPRHTTQKVWIIKPSGEDILRTGDSCGTTERPVALVIHGFPVQEIATGTNSPVYYYGMIHNLVSNGFIVVYAQYNWTAVLQPVGGHLWTDVEAVATTVYDGFEDAMQTAPTNARMDPNRIGIWGHSLGGGVTPIVLNKAAAAHPTWGSGSRWIAMEAAGDLFARCDDIPHRFFPPADFPWDEKCPRKMPPVPDNTKVLFISQAGDLPGIKTMTSRMVADMRHAKTHVRIRNDCSHSLPYGPCREDSLPDGTGAFATDQTCPSTPVEATECMAGHLLPTSYSDRTYNPLSARSPNHLVYYGIYRNVQAVADCALFGTSTSCNADLTDMGVWSDGTPATRAVQTTYSS